MKVTRSQLEAYLKNIRENNRRVSGEIEPLSFYDCGNRKSIKFSLDDYPENIMKAYEDWFKNTLGVTDESLRGYLDNLPDLTLSSDLVLVFMDTMYEKLGVVDNLYFGNIDSPFIGNVSDELLMYDMGLFLLIRKTGNDEYDLFLVMEKYLRVLSLREIKEMGLSDKVEEAFDNIYDMLFTELCDKDTFMSEVIMNK